MLSTTLETPYGFALADVISPWDRRALSQREGSRPAMAKVLQAGPRVGVDQDLDYMPVVFTGFSWHNLKGGLPLDAIPRLKGDSCGQTQDFWRRRVRGCRLLLCRHVLIEVDEATAIFPNAPMPRLSATTLQFLTLRKGITQWTTMLEMVGKAASCYAAKQRPSNRQS